MQLILLPINAIIALSSQISTNQPNGKINSKAILINISRKIKFFIMLEKAKTHLPKKQISFLYVSFEEYPRLLWSAFNPLKILLKETLFAFLFNNQLKSFIHRYFNPILGYFFIFFIFFNFKKVKLYKLFL